ncbi:hypothetical protein F8388_012700 [Cannabis sativa]|uniref:DUF4283 domain-containing protein n=1 Tax=Cannabis sativa TaxID=3483 RepID=A0A7J6HAH1_CANSA|nr:hypothetical protein F8388_012700 [Cannabis sativa]
MAKKKKTVRKPFIQDTEPIDKEIATGESSRFDGLSLMAEISEIGKLGHEVAIQEFASGSEIPIEERLTGSWAQNVEDEELVINQGTFEASAKSHWSALVKVHTSYRGLKLTSRIQFARILVEMDITDSPPKSIQYLNEFGQLVEQAVDYEWLHVKCKNCRGFGHNSANCRKGDAEVKRKEGEGGKKSVEQGLPQWEKQQVQIEKPMQDVQIIN